MAAPETEDLDDDLGVERGGCEIRPIEVAPELAGGRLDKALAIAAPDISRARLQSLIAEGGLSRNGSPVTAPASRAMAGTYELCIPPARAAEPEAQDLPLTVLFEDDQIIVIDKAAGMAAHPAPGTPDGTLVNALLFHCAGRLGGIGGVERPGIVHRLDKETSGVMVAAKTDAAHAGLAAQFAAHDIERVYLALTRGAPYPQRGAVRTRLGRSPHDRKKMAVLRSGGREAITHYATKRTFGPAEKPLAARVACTLETGRTHQIRVHLASKGSPCLGDPVYGSGPPAPAVRAAIEAAGLTRQALHATTLGFVHPTTGEPMRFDTPPPGDMQRLEALLEAL
jgi:23S rRNA pseudouridine1911/1915/1917 synthase